MKKKIVFMVFVFLLMVSCNDKDCNYDSMFRLNDIALAFHAVCMITEVNDHDIIMKYGNSLFSITTNFNLQVDDLLLVKFIFNETNLGYWKLVFVDVIRPLYRYE